MLANDYQAAAARTLIPDAEAPTLQGRQTRILWNTLGLAGEAGELANLVKKGLLHEHGLDTAKLQEELGDVCWYIAALCEVLDIHLADVLAGNIAKLERRYPAGWSTADSKQRVDVPEPSVPPLFLYRCSFCESDFPTNERIDTDLSSCPICMRHNTLGRIT